MNLFAILGCVLFLLGMGAWGGEHFTAEHYKVQIAAAQHASDVALSTAQAGVIAAQTERDTALKQVRKDNEKRALDDSLDRSVLNGRVHDLTAALRASTVSCAVVAAGGGSGTGAVPGGSGSVSKGYGELDAAYQEYEAATSALIAAGQHDARGLIAAQEGVPK